MTSISQFLDHSLMHTAHFELRVSNLFTILFIILVSRLAVWTSRKYLDRQVRTAKIDNGKRYAIYQIFKYLVYVISITLAIDSLGFNITVILAGSTALLVGIGLGLQDFFKDLVAGFIILWERTVSVGDVVEVNGTLGKIQEVGLRSTKLLRREDIILTVPNTRLTSENVINWSQHNGGISRFSIEVGVAYGSDTKLVSSLLLDAVNKHSQVEKFPQPTVIFSDFGSSSLNFKIHYFSRSLFTADLIKSDIRFNIDQKFRENNVSIPFPQRDIWIRENPKTP